MEITRVPSRCQSTWKSFQKLSKKGAGSLIKHSSTLATDQCRLGDRGWRLHYPPDRFTAPKLEISAPRETCGLDKEDDVYQIQDLSPTPAKHSAWSRIGLRVCFTRAGAEKPPESKCQGLSGTISSCPQLVNNGARRHPHHKQGAEAFAEAAIFATDPDAT